MLTSVSAQELSVDEIVNKANLAAYYATNGKADVKMVITDKNGQERPEITIFTKDKWAKLNRNFTSLLIVR